MKSPAQFWDKQAKKYNKIESRFDPTFVNILERTEKYLKKDYEILDFGCATGKKSIQLSLSVKKIDCLDISPIMINFAKENAKEQGIENIEFFNGTIYDDCLKKHSYDIIVSFGVLHLLADYKDVIRRVNELLKPDGLFISTTACLKEKMSLRDKAVLSMYLFAKKIGVLPMFLNMLKNCDVDNLIEEGDFEIVESENIFAGISIYYVASRKKSDRLSER